MILNPHPTPFLGPPVESTALDRAKTVVVPFGYEGGVSYGKGTAAAPQAIIEASQQVEFYDEELDAEPYHTGIATIAAPPIPSDSRQMLALLAELTEEIMAREKFPLVIGGDHSITTGFLRTVARRFPRFGVLQLDAHADLRESYEDNPFSHACTMARALEFTPHTVQIGIRSMSIEEARRVKSQSLSLCTMRQWRQGRFDLQTALRKLPRHVFLTIDVDVLDWSIVASTGTPEPGGMLWEEILELLQMVFKQKQIIGCDVVEMSHRLDDLNSPFAVAKLIYKIIGYRFSANW